MEKLKVAVIGCGRISEKHFKSIKTSEYAELTAVCDIKADRAKAACEEFGGRVYTDYRKMLYEEKLDAVHICLPHYLHAEASVAAFEKGVHVLCEKPMDINLKKAQWATDEAKILNCMYGIVFQCRYNESTVFIKKTIDSGKLGKILSVTSTLTWQRDDDYYSGSDWKGTWDKEGGGVIIDQAIHSIDLANWIIGSKVKSVSATVAIQGHNKIQVEDTACGLITYENGVRYGFYCMNNCSLNEPIEIKFFCENGKAVLSYDWAKIIWNDGTEEVLDLTDRMDKSLGDKSYWGVGHIKQINQFYRAVLGFEDLEISGENALETHRLICKIYEKAGIEK